MQPPPPEPLSEPVLERVTRWIAIAGGLLSIATAILVTTSVARRWLGFGPVPGDFELVQIGTAISVFSFLPLTQARRGNIMVDTFTAKLPPRVNHTIDAIWDFVFAAFMALIAYTLMNGAREAVSSRLNSMVLGVPLAPVFALCVILVAVLATTALVTGLRLLRARP